MPQPPPPLPETTPPLEPGQRQFPCSQCGANLLFAPGTASLLCPYCGTHNQITIAQAPVEELDYAEQLLRLSAHEDLVETLTVHCNTCGAESSFPPNITASTCPFCGAAIVAQTASRRQIKPRSLLPFYITQTTANDSFKQWLRSRWFAPHDLIQLAQRSGMNGAYVPFWTYDSNTTTDYTGQRGEDYTTTETYTAYENGKRVTRTRQVTRTRWYPASGQVANTFDDVLVVGTDSLPRHYVQKLEPWDLRNLVPYSPEFLGGFIGQAYDVDLPTGFERAKEWMEPIIHQTIRRDIGGDHQRISWTSTQYFDITFKHLLLPVWISAYRYRDKSYRFLINGRTGEVQGERPYSAVKITLFVLALLVVAILLWIVLSNA